MNNRQRCRKAVWVLTVISASLSMCSGLQGQAAKPAAPATAPVAPDKPPLKQEELEQLLAPIALYPDPLITQVLMASTYPLEIIQADRWAKAHKDLKDAALTTALEKESWDASVKSLVNFPTVPAMITQKLDL